eukprot:1347036-Amorphochlora_amoeboformis.AAC.1
MRNWGEKRAVVNGWSNRSKFQTRLVVYWKATNPKYLFYGRLLQGTPTRTYPSDIRFRMPDKKPPKPYPVATPKGSNEGEGCMVMGMGERRGQGGGRGCVQKLFSG